MSEKTMLLATWLVWNLAVGGTAVYLAATHNLWWLLLLILLKDRIDMKG